MADPLSEEISPLSEAAQATARMARAASIISLGNVASRVLGLARETVRAGLFGAGGAVDAFNVATIVPTMLYDLLIGGMINSSLVPVFSEYATERREELWKLVNALLSLTVIVMAIFIVIVEVFAPQVAYLLSSGSSPEVLALSAGLLRITIPAVLFLSLSGVLSGLLYALKRFGPPAFTAAVFNAGIVVVTLLFHERLGVASMAVGLLAGSALQLAMQFPALRDARLRPTLAFRQVGLRRVATLYTPIILGLLVDIFIGRPVSYNLASQTGEGGISWMNYATYLRQLPQGLVAIAVSYAVLPTLSVHAAAERLSTDGSRDSFLATLAQGLRLVTVLIVPASVGLFILAQPTVALLYENGAFTPFDTQMTSLALQFYVLGLPFAAIDLLLVFAFYARQDTFTPSLIGVATVVIYLGMAVALLPSLGLFSLMVADSFKLLLHTVISAAILTRRLGSMAKHGVMRAVGLTLIASAGMGLATYGTLKGVTALLPVGPLAEAAAVIVPGVVGVGIYFALITLLRVEEMGLVIGVVRRRLG